MRKIIGWLSEEDFDRYQRSYARVTLAVTGHPGLSPEEAQQAIIVDLNLFHQLRKKYDIEDDEAVEFSFFDGAILEDSE